MTRKDGFIGQLEGYLDEYEGLTPLPESVRDAVRGALPMTKQRRLWWPARRFLAMNGSLRYGLLGTAVLAAAILSVGLLTRLNPGPATTPTPTPNANPSASQPPFAFLGLLDAGTYSTAFNPPLRFTVPAGWSMNRNERDLVIIQPTALAPVGASILVCRDTIAVDATGQTQSAVGTDAASITSYLAHRGDLRNATIPTAAKIGSLDGYYLDFNGPKPPSDPVAVGPARCAIDVYPTQFTRLGVFDLPGGGNVLMAIYSPSGDPGIADVGTPIVESFVFDTP
jgi:hypothetical protein